MRLVPAWADYAVVAVFVAAWWGTFLLESDWTHPVIAVGWIVGTTLVAAFLFDTAVAIRQQGGELGGLYDWTT